MNNNFAKDYTFKNNFDKQICVILGRVLLYQLHIKKLSKADLCRLVVERGYKLSKTSLYNSFDGANFGAYHFGYWMKLFSVIDYNINADTFLSDYSLANSYFLEQKRLKQKK